LRIKEQETRLILHEHDVDDDDDDDNDQYSAFFSVDGISKLFVSVSLLPYCLCVLYVFIFVNAAFYELYMYTHEERTSQRLPYGMLLLLMVAIYRWRILKKIDNLEDVGVDGRVILKILKE
jgi:CDP-diglyceride synthetase